MKMLEILLERTILLSRWLLAPLYLALIAVLILFTVKAFQEVIHQMCIRDSLGIIGEVASNDFDRPKYSNYLYGAYGQEFQTGDGKRVMIVGLTRRQWEGLVKVTGLQAEIQLLGEKLGLNLNREGDRFKSRKEITALLEPWFRARKVDDFARSFNEAGVTLSLIHI